MSIRIVRFKVVLFTVPCRHGTNDAKLSLLPSVRNFVISDRIRTNTPRHAEGQIPCGMNERPQAQTPCFLTSFSLSVQFHLHCIELSRVDKAMRIHTYWDGTIRHINQGIDEQTNTQTHKQTNGLTDALMEKQLVQQ